MGEKGRCFPGPGSLLAGVVVETTLSLNHRTPTCTLFTPLRTCAPYLSPDQIVTPV